MYETLIKAAEFNQKCYEILEKLKEPVFKLIQRNGKAPYFDYKTDKIHFIDIHNKAKNSSYWDIFFKLSLLNNRMENQDKYLTTLELLVCFISYFEGTTTFYEISEEVKSLPRLRKTYYGETQEEVDTLKDTMKEVNELLLDLHREVSDFDLFCDAVEL